MLPMEWNCCSYLTSQRPLSSQQNFPSNYQQLVFLLSMLVCSRNAVMLYKRLGKISDILHLNNENNQLERRARPPRDVPLDTQSWTWASSLSSRVVAVTTATYTSWTLAQVLCIRFSTDFPSRSALEDGSELRRVNTILATSYCSRWQSYLKKSYDQIWAIIADG